MDVHLIGAYKLHKLITLHVQLEMIGGLGLLQDQLTEQRKRNWIRQDATQSQK